MENIVIIFTYDNLKKSTTMLNIKGSQPLSKKSLKELAKKIKEAAKDYR